jgi:hypothetical protein
MNELKISVKIDRKSALLAGRVLGETEIVTVSPETIGDVWSMLVETLTMSSTPPSSYLTVDDPTVEAIRSKLVSERESKEKKLAEESIELERLIAVKTAEVNALELAATAPMESSEIWVREDLSEIGGGPFSFTGFKRDLPAVRFYYYEMVDNSLFRLRDQADAIKLRSQSEVLSANQAGFIAARPDLDRQKSELDAKKAADEAAKKLAAAIKYAERLQSGEYTRETDSYNERRHSAPWIARVDFSSGSKGEYSFGESSGKWGSAGTLSVACAPGDFIAWGQKDLRNPAKSDHNLLRMRADGSMESFDSKAAAYSAFKAAKKLTAV